MPLIRELLVTLRTLMEDEPQTPKYRRRRHNSGSKNNRNRQTSALVLTFRDLFRSGGLNIILDEVETNRRSNRIQRRNISCSSDVSIHASDNAHTVTITVPTNIPDQSLISLEPNIITMTCPKFNYQDELTPLLCEDSGINPCTEIIPRPLSLSSKAFIGSFPLVRRIKTKPENLTVPINPEDESKTVATLRKVAKWSPRKQNSTTFAVSLPAHERHSALAVVENAVNRVKEEQMVRKKKKRFLWLRFC